MRRYVLDTNVLIGAMRSPAEAERLAEWQRRYAPFIWQHSVVAAELLAGARDEEAWQRWREAWLRPAERIGRVLTPTHATWLRATRILARLSGSGAMRPGALERGFLNDCLIAATAREHPFTLVTFNVGDFERIAAVQPELQLCVPLP